MSLNDIVNVQITFDAPAVSQVGFGTLMILSAHKNFNQRLKFYGNVDEVLEDFSSDSPEYEAVNAAFTQVLRPSLVAIGRRSVDEVTITVDDAIDGFEYVVTINGEEFSYTALTADSVADIGEGLTTAINGGNEPVTATDNENGTFTLNADVADQAYTLQVGDNLSQEDPLSASASMIDDLTAINEFNENWYGLMLISRDKQDQLDAAGWVESRSKLFCAATDDEDVLDPLSEDDIAFQLQALNYTRSFVFYHDLAETAYPDAAIMGKQLTTDPGSSTWKFKSLVGIPVTEFSSSQRNAAFDKNANIYEEIAGVGIFRQGRVATSNQTLFIDLIRGKDWLQSNIQRAIYQQFTAEPKVPYTNQGIALISLTIRTELDAGVDAGYLDPEGAIEVSVPTVRDISVADRANRHLPDISFSARLAGAIHSVDVRGVLSV